MEFDPLNSPSRTATDPIVSTSPFSSLFANPPLVVEPPLIDFSASPTPAPPAPSFQPKPLALSSARQTLFPPDVTGASAPTRPRRASPLQFSVLEDSFSDFPPSFNDYSVHGAVREHDCDEGGLVSFVQDSPPPSLSRTRPANHERGKENASPTKASSVAGKKWGVMHRLREDKARRRSRSLSPVKEVVHSPYNASTVGGDSIAQIGNVDLSLIQDEGGSFLLADDDYSTIGQSFEHEQAPCQSPGNLSQIGEEDEGEGEEEDEEDPVQAREVVTVDEGISVGLSTMFLNKPTGDYDLSLIEDQSRFAKGLAAAGGRTFDQSTLPRNFHPPPVTKPDSKSTSRSNSSTILPPELVSPVKARSNGPRTLPPPSASSKPFQSLPTPAPSPPSLSQDQSQFSLALANDVNCSFLDKSSQSFIKECKTPRKKPFANKGRSSDMSDLSEEGTLGSSEGEASRAGSSGGEVGETTEFGFTQWFESRNDDTSTAIVNQLPPTSVLNPETTRTIELCLQRPLDPDNNNLRDGGNDRSELASSTRTIKASNRGTGKDEEVDLMGMEEPSLLLQNQTLAFAGDLTMENQSVLVSTATRGTPSSGVGGGGGKETGAERLKRRMAELRAQQSLYAIPATPVAAPAPTTSNRFVSLLDQTPQQPHSTLSRPVPRSTVRRPAPQGPTLARSKSEGLVSGGGVSVGTLISFDTPSSSTSRLSASSSSSSSSFATPARPSASTGQRRLPPRTSYAPSGTPLSRPAATTTLEAAPPSAQKTPGERKETTRARLERMRTERKQREEELLRRSASPVKPGQGGAGAGGGGVGLKRSNSVGTRLSTDRTGGIARSQSSNEVGVKGGSRKKGTTATDATELVRSSSSKPPTLTERMIASSTKPIPRLSTTSLRPPAAVRPTSTSAGESMPPPTLTSRRASLVPSASSGSSFSMTGSSSRIVKRQSLAPSTSHATSRRSSIVSRAPLRPTTASSSVPAGSGIVRK